MQASTCVYLDMEYTEKAIQILEAAKELFSENGFKAVTTREIAKKASVNEVTIFRHFENKEKLFNHMLKFSISKPDISNYINSEETDLENYIRGVGKLIQTIFTNNLELFRIELFERQALNKRNQVSEIPNKIKVMMTKYLVEQQNMKQDEAEIFTISFMSSVHGLCMNIYFSQTFKPIPNFDKCFNLIIARYK